MKTNIAPRTLRFSPVSRTLSCVALGTILVAVPAAGAVPLDGSMSVGVQTSVFNNQSGFTYASNSGSDNGDWASTPATLSVATSAPANLPGGSGVNAFASGSATWAADGDSGAGSFTYGWSFTDGNDYANPGMQTNENGPNWTYTFTADATGNFVMNYDLTSTGDPLGLSKGFFIGSDGGSTLNLFAAESGTYTQAVTAGSTYEVLFANNGNSFDRDGGTDSTITLKFDWTLPGGAPPTGPGAPGVPDASSTLALLGGGLGALGFLARRVGPSEFGAT